MNTPISDATLTISWAIFFNITITPIITGFVTIFVCALVYIDISENMKNISEHAKVIHIRVNVVGS